MDYKPDEHCYRSKLLSFFRNITKLFEYTLRDGPRFIAPIFKSRII
jgi:hypothetical protein